MLNVGRTELTVQNLKGIDDSHAWLFFCSFLVLLNVYPARRRKQRSLRHASKERRKWNDSTEYIKNNFKVFSILNQKHWSGHLKGPVTEIALSRTNRHKTHFQDRLSNDPSLFQLHSFAHYCSNYIYYPLQTSQCSLVLKYKIALYVLYRVILLTLNKIYITENTLQKLEYRPLQAHFSKAPETFRARKAIFS